MATSLAFLIKKLHNFWQFSQYSSWSLKDENGSYNKGYKNWTDIATEFFITKISENKPRSMRKNIVWVLYSKILDSRCH